MNYILPTIISLILLSGCGYKPSAKFAREVVGENISTSINISASDPANSVIIKDAISSAIVSIFNASLSDKSVSDTHLELSTGSPSYKAIEFDENGFVVSYRMSIKLNINSYTNGIKKSYTSTGTYDFAVSPNATITDQERFEAIKFSATKAIRSFVSKVSVDGARKSKNKKEN